MARAAEAVVTGRARLALLGLCVALRVVSLVRPCLSDDEAIYAVVARELLTGHALYRDVVDHKPPAIYVVYAATQAVGGPTGGMVLLHGLLILVVLATALALARIVRRHAGADPRAALAAAALWCVSSTTLVDVDALAANCELFMMLPLTLGVEAVLDARAARRPLAQLALAGALTAAAAMFKYQGAIQLPLFAIAVLAVGGVSVRARLAGLVAIGVGFAAVIAAVVGALAWIGALPAALFWLKFNFAYIEAGSSRGEVLLRLAARGGLVVAGAPLLYGAALAALPTARRAPFVRFAAGWAVVSALAVSVGGRFFGHYFHQLTAPLAVLAAPVVVRLWDRRRALVIAAAALPALAFAALAALHDPVMRAYGEPDPDYARVVAALDRRGPGALCVWGNSPVLYFLAERPLGCRFSFANYLTGLSPATATQSDPTVDSSRNVVPEAWDMLEVDLAERAPRFIVDGSPGNVAFYGKYPPARFPRLARVLACAYDAVDEVAGMRIYERRAAARCPAPAARRP